MQFALLSFLLFRIYDFSIAYLAPFFIKFYGNFSHPKVLALFSLPKFIKSFANFDGIFYIRIASQGYEEFEQAFFPLYPLLMNLFSKVWDNKLVIGLLISNISFILGIFVFKKYLDLVVRDKNKVFWSLIFLLVFPTSFFFGAVYTESLFFLLIICAFYFFKKENFLLAGLFSYFAATTRFIASILIVPFMVYLFFKDKRFKLSLSKLIPLAAPLLGLTTYSFYLWKTFGNGLMFFTSQTAFSAGRSTKLIMLPQVYFRYLKIFLTASKNFQYFVSAVEFTLFSLVFFGVLWYGYKMWRRKNWDLTALSAFSLLNILVPTLTGTFLSTPRFSLLSLSFFVFLSEIKNRNLKLGIALIFILLHTVLLAYFIQGYFIS